MPNREDETWRNAKGNLRYCSKHQRYYDENLGCQLCFLDKIEEGLKRGVGKTPQLKECPGCKEKSLFWVESLKRHECLNANCCRIYLELDQDWVGGGQISKPPSEANQDSLSHVVEEAPTIDPVDKKWKKPKRKFFPFGK